MSQTTSKIECCRTALVRELGHVTGNGQWLLKKRGALFGLYHLESSALLDGGDAFAFSSVSKRRCHSNPDQLEGALLDKMTLVNCLAEVQYGQTRVVSVLGTICASCVWRTTYVLGDQSQCLVSTAQFSRHVPLLTFWNLACSGVLSPVTRISVTLNPIATRN